MSREFRSFAVVAMSAIALSTSLFAKEHHRFHHRASPQNPARNDALTEAVLFSDILDHYHVSAIHKTGVTGMGQHIAIINYDKIGDATKSDVEEFFAKADEKTQLKTQVNFIGDGSEDDTAPTELELDIEMAGMIAPGATLDVYSFADAVADDVAIGAVLSKPEVKILSSSWSPCEREVDPAVRTTVDSMLADAANRGVTVLYASGDYGLACNTNKKGDPEGTSTRSWPTANPWVTAVGATSFKAPKDEVTGEFSELAWSHSGGGPSRLYEMPDYQKGWLPPDYFRGSHGKGWRGIPDIAMIGGDPGIKVWSRKEKETTADWHSGEGTSFAAPEFAGFVALVNEARLNDGKKSIGFLNGILYGMTDEDRRKTLRTITKVDQGSRRISSSSKWNGMTGLGSPVADELFNYLKNLP